MAYVSLVTWVDMTDGHEYHPTESFPHDGREISAERVSELVSGNNNVGYPLIVEIEDKSAKRTKKKEE